MNNNKKFGFFVKFSFMNIIFYIDFYYKYKKISNPIIYINFYWYSLLETNFWLWEMQKEVSMYVKQCKIYINLAGKFVYVGFLKIKTMEKYIHQIFMIT